MVPEVCEVVPNELGTAPGMLFRKGSNILIALPGVPFEMLHMVEHEVIPLLNHEASPDVFVREVVRLTGVPESEVALRMESLEETETLPAEVEVAYLPKSDGLWLEISAHLPLEKQKPAAQLVKATADRVFGQFEQEAYSRTTEDLAQIVQKAFIEKGLTLAVAESMTGGMVAAKLVSIPGGFKLF